MHAPVSSNCWICLSWAPLHRRKRRHRLGSYNCLLRSCRRYCHRRREPGHRRESGRRGEISKTVGEGMHQYSVDAAMGVMFDAWGIVSQTRYVFDTPVEEHKHKRFHLNLYMVHLWIWMSRFVLSLLFWFIACNIETWQNRVPLCNFVWLLRNRITSPVSIMKNTTPRLHTSHFGPYPLPWTNFKTKVTGLVPETIIRTGTELECRRHWDGNMDRASGIQWRCEKRGRCFAW